MLKKTRKLQTHILEHESELSPLRVSKFLFREIHQIKECVEVYFFSNDNFKLVFYTFRN